MEVSSGVHSKRAQARSPSRFSRDAPLASINEQTSSLQALAAVADSGEFKLSRNNLFIVHAVVVHAVVS